MGKVKEEYIAFRVNASEKRQFKKFAAANGMSLSTLIRYLLLNEIKKTRGGKENECS